MTDPRILQHLITNMVDAVVIIDDRGRIKEVNPSTLSHFGYRKEDLVGKNVSILMPEPYHSNHDRYLTNYRDTGAKKILNASRELIAKRKNGSLFPIFLHVNEAWLENERIFIGVIHDISGRKLAETAYREADNKLQAILENAVEGMIVIDQRGRIDMANPAALRLFGYEENEVLAKNVSILMPEPDRSAHDGYIKKYQTTGERKIIGIGREVKGRRKDGSTFPLKLSVSEVRLRSGLIYVGLLHDLTAEHEAQRKLQLYATELREMNTGLENKVRERTEELEKANIDLKSINSQLEKEIKKRRQAEQKALAALNKEKELNELKSRFVSMASHEFRTPLSGILTSVSLLSRYSLPEHEEKRNKHIATIKSSVHNLTSILNDFLSLDKLEAGKIEFKPSVFSLQPFIHELISEVENTCRAGQSIQVELKSKLDEVYADRHLLKNIFINLISNAIKYSSEGQTIEVNVSLVDDGLRLQITDHGIGIPEEDRPHMFERLFRASNVTNIQGTGLGLNIVKKYVDLHGGTIAFESTYGEGTTFTVVIPQIPK